MLESLRTEAGLHMDPIPLNVYPRPQLKRENWICLNGLWDYQVVGRMGTRKIVVPFPPESLLSGIHERYRKGAHLVYFRTFKLNKPKPKERLLLHFGAVDQISGVYVNSEFLGKHEGGYLPFTYDITPYVQKGVNTLKVLVSDDLHKLYPYGKQKQHRGGMWYTPVSGIWQTVWAEWVPEEYIRGIKIQTDKNTVKIEVDGPEAQVLFEGKTYTTHDGVVQFEVEEPILWSPENPHLYSFEIQAGEDHCSSYFALRTLSVQQVDGKERLCLNGEPYFFNGVLDQGYFSDGLYTPASYDLYEQDILKMKALGFNTLRKHIKVEPEVFYELCDRLGMVVFQDMVNSGKYSFLKDTVLPTLGFQKMKDLHVHKNPKQREVFKSHMLEEVTHLYNHPSICLWTIFNEGWGQFCSDELYDLLKSVDDTRFIDSTSGWFHQTKSDCESLHIYFKKLKLGLSKKPQLISEYGGYVYKVPYHSANPHQNYGYRMFKSHTDYIDALKQLMEEVKALQKEGLCGAIYTQLSDVEDEVNGLLTYDRAVNKIQMDNH